MTNDDWSWEEEENQNSFLNWLRKHWETIALHLIVWSLLIIALCSLIQLIIAWRK